jgi:hypothetical protein
MADLALVFHWPPDVMGAMSVADIMLWRAKAAERWNQER